MYFLVIALVVVYKYYFCCSRFWEAVQQVKALPQKDVQDKVNEIWSEFLAHDASCPINVDAQSYETTKKNMENTDRWSFDVAAVCVSTVSKYYRLF